MSDEEFTPEQWKEQHQHGMMEDLVKTSDKYMKEHGINIKIKDIPPDEPGGYIQKIYVTVELSPDQYKMAVAIAHMVQCKNFDEYVSELVVRDLEMLRDGGEQLADWIKSVMPEEKEQGT